MATIKNEPGTNEDICDRIIEACQGFPEGVGDKFLQINLKDGEPMARARAINSLLQTGKIDLFKSESKGLLYKLKSTRPVNIKGDQEENVVYEIIEESGNKGTWIRGKYLNVLIVPSNFLEY